LVVDRSNVSALDEEQVRTCIGEKQVRTKAFIGGAALAVASLCSSHALAGDEPAVPAATAMPGGREMMDSMCPMKVQGTAVKAGNVDGGVALVFTTKTGDVEDVRQHVRHMAQMHGTNAAGMATTTTVSGVNRTPAGVTIRREALPASTASAEDVERGAGTPRGRSTARPTNGC
jgi:hypothetical protein